MNGAFLALAGALAVRRAIPLGILGVRTLHHGNALKTAPLSASSAAGAGQNGAATFTALAGVAARPRPTRRHPVPGARRGRLAQRDRLRRRAVRSRVHLQLPGHGPRQPRRVA